ncbi:hypothetical protein [Streptomyces sp. NPDC093970]|uniref:hypothetical protein n=1 Tax=Streptomyces sp. NPDC093970 TaxID=3155076 RepID=UPI00342E292A
MIATRLMLSALALGFNHMVESRYGGAGALALFLIGAGVKARSTRCTSIGAVMLLLLLTQA